MAHNNNNVNIGSIGAGNTVNITQKQTPDARHVEYSMVDGSIQHLSRSEINKGALTFWISASLPVLAIVADGLGVLSFLGLQTLWALAVVVPVAFVGAAITNGKRKIAEHSFIENEAWFIDDRWVEQNDDGDYFLYKKVATCIYPKCSGSVAIVPAPPREQGNHTLVGVCSVGGHRHTYTIDYNCIGFPEQFDWRPIEKRES
jgi:hypothetical protein